MILSDREIQSALGRRAIRLSPRPSVDAWSSTAVDLTLAQELMTWRPPSVAGVSMPVSPSDPNYKFNTLVRDCGQRTSMSAEGFILKSGQFALGWTVEQIQLPHQSRLAARVEGKSSLARLGVGVHVTAPTIHAGFGYNPRNLEFPGNPIQLEIWNVGPLDVRLTAGMRICQLIFEWVDGTPNKGYEGQFTEQGPDGPGPHGGSAQ